MSRRALGLVAACLLAACAPPRSAAPAGGGPVRARNVDPAPAARPARFFQGLPEEAFWVTHDAALDRVISGGARLELSPAGEILGAAWDASLTGRGDALAGALAVPEAQGGGFLHWSKSRLFRSATFTGPLEPIDSAGDAIRGVRPGLAGPLVITEAGPREIDRQRKRLVPYAEPGIADAGAADASRAIRLDVFGRASFTPDGGQRWIDLTPRAGTSVRAIGAGGGELSLETWLGRFVVGPGGDLAPSDVVSRGSFDPVKAFQLPWKGTRASERDEWPWGYRDATPLQAAVIAGADAGDGTAIGVVGNVAARVDLATGRTLHLESGWIPSGLDCQPMRAPDGVLFACAWERYQGSGGYVLRSEGGGAPRIERAFTDDGGFLADDEGALGFTGSCRATAHLFDPEDLNRGDVGPDAPQKPVICVRRLSPGADGRAPEVEWVERRVEVGDGTLLGWIPRVDGTAVALVMASDPLPEPAGGAPRVSEQGGVRVVRLRREIEGWGFARPAWSSSRGMARGVDRRFHARADGSIDGWLTLADDTYTPVALGVTIDAAGHAEAHELPPAMRVMSLAGDHGAAIDDHGELFETLDHGRTWQSAGLSPAPPGTFNLAGCSALGCVLGSVVRLGWGKGALAPKIALDEAPDLEPWPAPARLSCTPVGAPVPLAAPPPAPPGQRQTVVTAWGDTLEIIRDKDAPVPKPPAGSGPSIAPSPAPAPPPSSTPAAKPPRSSPAVLRTHTLQMRPPLAPLAPLRRLNATDAGFSVQRRSGVLPILGPSGDISLLVAGDTTELVVSGEKITSLPAFESRRYYYNDGGGWGGVGLPGGRSLLLGEVRRRLTLEEHGASPPPPPLFLTSERDAFRRRPLTLGRRDDGTAGILIFDGAAPETAAVAPIDRAGAGLLDRQRLAPWSSVVTADDPRCQAPDPTAYRALVLLDPSTWLELDTSALPGVTPARQGLALVRWGRDRVCLEGLDVGVLDSRRKSDASRGWSVVARWDQGRGAKTGNVAVLRSADLRQDLVCKVERQRAK